MEGGDSATWLMSMSVTGGGLGRFKASSARPRTGMTTGRHQQGEVLPPPAGYSISQSAGHTLRHIDGATARYTGQTIICRIPWHTKPKTYKATPLQIIQQSGFERWLKKLLKRKRKRITGLKARYMPKKQGV